MQSIVKLRWILLSMLLLSACHQPPQWNGLDVSDMLPDLSFELTDSDGNTVNASAYHGKTTLLFFGFTNCPGVCPATLGQLSVALRELGKDADKVQVLLVSVDPERDTPEAMKTYTAKFGPWLHGLTGPAERLKTLNNAYKVDFMAQQADEDGNYEVVHSGRVFAFDKTGRCRLLLGDTTDTASIVDDLKLLVSESVRL
jgi:protein SCO1/2